MAHGCPSCWFVSFGVSTPSFWTGVEVYKSVEWLALALERSGSADISLSFHHLPTVHLAMQLGVLLDSACRLRRLSFCSVREEDILPGGRVTLHPLFRMPMPHLRELVLPIRPWRREAIVQHTRSSLPCVDIDVSHLPVLRDLALAYAIVPCQSLASFSRLRSIQLRSCTADTSQGSLSPNQFLDVLEACRELETLDLRSKFVSSVIAPIGPPSYTLPRAWVMPRLRSLRVDDYPGVVSWLIAQFEVPPRFIHLTGYHATPRDWRSDPEVLTFLPLLPVDCDRRRYIPVYHPTRAVITILNHRYELKIFGDMPDMEGALTLSAYTEWSPRFFCWTRALSRGIPNAHDVLRSIPITSLTIHGDWEYSPYTTNWRSVYLPDFNSLEELSFIGRGSVVNLLSALGPTWFYPNAVLKEPVLGRLVCPALRRLQIKGARWEKELNECIYFVLRQRQSLGAPPLELQLSVRCKGPRRAKLFHDTLATICELVQPLVRSVHYVLEP